MAQGWVIWTRGSPGATASTLEVSCPRRFCQEASV